MIVKLGDRYQAAAEPPAHSIPLTAHPKATAQAAAEPPAHSIPLTAHSKNHGSLPGQGGAAVWLPTPAAPKGRRGRQP